MNIIFYSIKYSIGKKILLDRFISIYSLIIIFTFAFSLILFYKTDDIFSEIKILLTET